MWLTRFIEEGLLLQGKFKFKASDSYCQIAPQEVILFSSFHHCLG